MNSMYLIAIRKDSLVDDVVDTVLESIGQATQWADDNSTVGDMVVVSEVMEAADGEYEVLDHVTSWVVDV